MKQRIWELDAARGVCVLGMVVFHLLYDLQYLFPVLPAGSSGFLDFVANWGGTLFFLISGISATLGSHPVRRGLAVTGCGLAVTAVTAVMAALQLVSRGMIIRFGVLHCLGICMLLWPLVRKLPRPAMALLALGIVCIGIYWDGRSFPVPHWLFPLGLKYPGFASGDYFPLFPFFGFFLLGAVLGKTLYSNKLTLFPKVNTQSPLVRFLSAAGRWSLPIYMLHQPVITGIITLLEVTL